MLAEGATLETRGLNRSFGSNPVISDVTFSLKPGERRALIGPNGAGKTTFVNLLTGRLRASSGSVLLNGKDITQLNEARRIRLGIGRTFQITSLFPKMTVRENVFLAVAECEGIAGNLLRPALSYRPQLERTDELLHRVGLSDVAHVEAQLLPYGRQRLLEIAIALALRPKVLLLDEPAAGIPTAESHVILDIIATMPKDIAVLLIDHDMDLVFRFAQQISVLVQGSILVEGAPGDIAADPRVREVYLGDSKHGRPSAA
jgi:branched-chain amino acid transport system ATP-binding protein